MALVTEPTSQVPEVLVFERQAELSPSSSATLLLVDDDMAIRHVVRRVLHKHGYVVLEAEGGAAALQLLRDAAVPIDLILTDIVMPEMTGIEFVQHLTEEFPSIPLVYLSGYLSEPSVREQIQSPEAWVLAKPLSAPMLIATIRGALAYGVQHDQPPVL